MKASTLGQQLWFRQEPFLLDMPPNCCKGKDAKLCAKNGKDCCDGPECKFCCDKNTAANTATPNNTACCAAVDHSCCHTKSKA